MKQRGHGQAGTTLIETIIAMAIVAVVCLGGITFLQYMNEHATTGSAFAASQTELARFAARLRRFYYVGSESVLSFEQRVRTEHFSANRHYWRFGYGTWRMNVGNTCAPIPAKLANVVPSFNKAKINAAIDKLDGAGDCTNAATGAVAGIYSCPAGENATVYIDVTGRPREYFPAYLRSTADGGTTHSLSRELPVMSVVCRQNTMPANWDNFVIFFGFVDASRKGSNDPWSRIRWTSATVRLPPTMSYSNGAAMLP